MDAIIDTLPPDTGPGWIILAVVLLAIFGTPAIFSEEVAKKRFWLISTAARHVQARRVRAIESEAAVDDARVSVLTKRIADLEKLHTEAHNSLTSEVSRLRRVMDEERIELTGALDALETRLDRASEYIAWATQWARSVIHVAAEHDLTDSIPTWMSYRAWLKANPKASDSEG